MNSFLSKYFSSKAIALFFVLLIAVFAFLRNGLPLHWLLLSAFTVLYFFGGAANLTRRWAGLPAQVFGRRLFRTALIIRLVWVVSSYFMYQLITGQPFEFDSADAIGYHGEAVWIVDLLHSGRGLEPYFNYIGSGYSDMGYPFWLGLQYLVTFQSIFIARVIKAILGAYTVGLVYRLATRNFGEPVGRMAGILAMLLPNMVYYCGLHTKETEMVFLTVAFINQADILIRSRSYGFKPLVITILLGSSLFFFRTVLGIAAFFALFTAIAFTSSRVVGLARKIFIFIWAGVFALMLLGGSIMGEVNHYWEARTDNLESQMDNFSQRRSGNILAKYGKTAIFAPVIVLAPFPTMVNIPGQDNQMMLSGAYFTRNIYAFFVVVSLIWLMGRGHYKAHLLILSFVGSYLAVLSMSGFALSERFHMPAVPFLLILAACGVSVLRPRDKGFFIAYLVIVFLIIIGWNWFKLAGRGLV